MDGLKNILNNIADSSTPKLSKEEIKQKAIDNYKGTVFGWAQKLFVIVITLSIEAYIVKLLWNFVFTNYALGYMQSLCLLMLSRQLFTSTSK